MKTSIATVSLSGTLSEKLEAIAAQWDAKVKVVEVPPGPPVLSPLVLYGVIYLIARPESVVDWFDELGFDGWNAYRGDLDVLRATGVYTQEPGSNPVAARWCGLPPADGARFVLDPASGANKR